MDVRPGTLAMDEGTRRRESALLVENKLTCGLGGEDRLEYGENLASDGMVQVGKDDMSDVRPAATSCP